MSELIKNKRKIQYNLIILLLLTVAVIGLVIGASPSFKGNSYGIILLVLFIIEIPIILNISITGINSIDEIIDNEDHRQSLSSDEMEKMEDEIDKKVQEADGLTLNLNELGDDMGNYNNWEEFGNVLLIAISKQLEIVTGLVYKLDVNDAKYKSIANYAYYSEDPVPEFTEGEGLIGQVVKDKKAFFVEEIPDGYVKVISGLGNHNPKFLAIIPIVKDTNVIGVLEIATFKSIEQGLSKRIFELSEFLGEKASILDDNNETLNT
jgi:methyl-accepting chemotaxis protein